MLLLLKTKQDQDPHLLLYMSKSINETYVRKDFQVYDCMVEQDRSRLMMSELVNE